MREGSSLTSVRRQGKEQWCEAVGGWQVEKGSWPTRGHDAVFRVVVLGEMIVGAARTG